MTDKRKRSLILSSEEKTMLEKISKSRIGKRARVERAQYLLSFASGETISSLARKSNTNRPKVQRVIDKAIAYGVATALDDLPGRGRKPVISERDKAWILHLACQKPRALGYPEETWTMNALAHHIRSHCLTVNAPALLHISRGTVHKLLSQSNIKPHQVRYYLERTDPDFERKMNAVLHVYKEAEILREEGERGTFLVSYDEKPGIQAIGNTFPDLSPEVGSRSTFLRDAHYQRWGTVSILSGIDLLTGHIHTKVCDHHTSDDFITFLQTIDDAYPPDETIKIILDNHSAHTSKKTQAFLKEKGGRFELVFTPKHGSWLNLIEVFFSKLTRCLLKNIRVSSKEELVERIYDYIDDLNREPVVFKWKYKLDEI